MAKIVIIGAGLTGLSAAYHLEKKGFTRYKIFEKESVVGGLCRSTQQDGFTFDFTGHLLHISDPYFRSFIEKTIGINNLHSITRRSFIYSHDTYTKYPYQINLHGLPEKIIAECLEGFVKREKSVKKPKSFVQWVSQKFGNGFGKHFFFPYQQKIFAYNVYKITASWTGRFVPSTSLDRIIRGALTNNDDGDIGYNSHFFYPKKGGIMAWVQSIAKQIDNPIYTNFCVKKIDMQRKVIYFTNGHIEPFDQLITTMPLDILLASVHDTAATSLKKARHHLLCNSVINFNLGVRNPNLSDKHWIYFPEKKYPFYRIGFPHNFSPLSVPAGCSSLYGEFAHINKSSRWIKDMLKKALTSSKKLLNITDQELVTEKIMHISHAYVIYDFWRERNLKKILGRLQEYNVHSVGRYGQWKYASMQEAIMDGKKIAETMIITPAQKIYPSIQRIPKQPVPPVSKKEIVHE